MASRIVKNIGFLSVSQGANYLLPLVTIPYITRVVGPDNYGLVEFGTTIMLYFSAIVIYGFSFTATRKIATYPEQSKRVASIFATALYTRLFLFLLVSLLFVLLLFCVPMFAENQQLLLYAFPVVFGWALYPEFLFQGLQKLSVIAIANLAVKVLAAILIFVLLREKADYYLVVGINAFAQITVSIGTIYYAFRVLPETSFPRPKFRLIQAYLKSGWYIFLSHFFTRVYTFGSIVFLGFLLGKTELGLFAAAMKLVIVGQSFLFTPLGGALFPHFANLYKQSIEAYKKAHRKFMRIMLVATILASLTVALFPSFWVGLVFGDDYLSVAPYLQYMIPILAITTFSHFALKQGLMILRKDRLHLNVVIMVGLASLVLNYTLISFFRLEGAVWAKISVELLLAVIGWFYYKRAIREINPNN